MDWVVDPFQAEFVRNGALAAAAVGALCGVVGCFVIVRGMALMADSLAHGVLPGIAVAFLLTAGEAGEDPNQLAISLGALAAGLLTALATSRPASSARRVISELNASVRTFPRTTPILAA